MNGTLTRRLAAIIAAAALATTGALALAAPATAAPARASVHSVMGPAKADWMYGNPNFCTHSISIGVGLLGTKSATYVKRYSYWTTDYHMHYVFVEYNPIGSNSPNWHEYRWVKCSS